MAAHPASAGSGAPRACSLQVGGGERRRWARRAGDPCVRCNRVAGMVSNTSRVQQQTQLRLRREQTPSARLGALGAPHSHIPGYRVYRRLVRLAARTQSAGDEGPRARGLCRESLGCGWRGVVVVDGCKWMRRAGSVLSVSKEVHTAARAEANRVAAQPRGCSVASRGSGRACCHHLVCPMIAPVC